MKPLSLALLLTFSYLQAQSMPKPHVAPFFGRVDDGPAFFVECVNTDAYTTSSGSSVWPLKSGTVRVDGNLIDFGNMTGAGLTTDVAPSELWRGIIVLRQSETRYFPAVKFGALVRSTLVHPLTPGKHTISVQCHGVWSDEFEFYWEQEDKQQ